MSPALLPRVSPARPAAAAKNSGASNRAALTNPFQQTSDGDAPEKRLQLPLGAAEHFPHHFAHVGADHAIHVRIAAAPGRRKPSGLHGAADVGQRHAGRIKPQAKTSSRPFPRDHQTLPAQQAQHLAHPRRMRAHIGGDLLAGQRFAGAVGHIDQAVHGYDKVAVHRAMPPRFDCNYISYSFTCKAGKDIFTFYSSPRSPVQTTSGSMPNLKFRFSPSMRRISSPDSSKSNTRLFSAMRSSRDDLGMTTYPC